MTATGSILSDQHRFVMLVKSKLGKGEAWSVTESTRFDATPVRFSYSLDS